MTKPLREQGDLPQRFWICPTCRSWSGRAGHVGCTGPNGETQPMPVKCVPVHAIITRLVEMADALDQNAVAGTAETLRRAAAVLEIEGNGHVAS